MVEVVIFCNDYGVIVCIMMLGVSLQLLILFDCYGMVVDVVFGYLDVVIYVIKL